MFDHAPAPATQAWFRPAAGDRRFSSCAAARAPVVAAPARPHAAPADRPSDALGNLLARSCRQRAERVDPFFAGQCVLARKISYDAADDVYLRDGERGSWQKLIIESSARRYNDNFGTTLKSTDELPDTDRTHVIPFATIESAVVDFLNGDLQKELFDVAVEGLFPSALTHKPEQKLGITTWEAKSALTAWEYAATTRAQLKKEIAKLSPDPSRIVILANRLVGRLNNSPDNVRVGVAAINRHISDRWDPVFKATPKGQHTVYSPRTESMGWSFASIGYEPDAVIEQPHGSYLNPNMPAYAVPVVGSSQHASRYGTLPPPRPPWL